MVRDAEDEKMYELYDPCTAMFFYRRVELSSSLLSSRTYPLTLRL